MPKAEDGVSFGQVLNEELEEIKQRRDSNFDDCSEDTPVYEKALKNKLVGLAFSGGGIRSATFNLGILQFLAKYRLLGKVDYLSTVSGGGYIGSWLSAWINRESLTDVEEKLETRDVFGSQLEEHRPLMFLRQYSNYLTPRVGMFSPDSWALGSTFLRNLLLNFAVFAPLLVLVLLAPMYLSGGVANLMEKYSAKTDSLFLYIYVATVVLMAFSSFFMGRALSYHVVPDAEPPSYSTERTVFMKVVFPLFVSAILLCLAIWWFKDAHKGSWITYALILGLSYMVPFILGWWLTEEESGLSTKAIAFYTLWMLFSSGVWFGLLYGVWYLLARLDTKFLGNVWYALTFGPLLVCVVYTATVTVHIGLFGRGFPDEKREWWSRIGGWLFIIVFVWTAYFALILFGGPVLLWGGKLTLSFISIGWIASTVWGLLAGKGAKTSGDSGKIWDVFIRIVPYVFIAGLLMLCSLALSIFVIWRSGSLDDYRDIVWNTEIDFSGILMNHVYFLSSVEHPVFMYIALVSAGILIVALWRIDINNFSLHLLYRNRLVRCYLGASNKMRNANRFIGFDPHDDLKLNDLVSENKKEGPYHIINTTLNLVGGDELAWQKRKAASFVFTPLYCGYELIRDKRRYGSEEPPRKKVLKSAYQRTAEHASLGLRNNGVNLGMAMAISGAAASPNMGYYSSQALTFLMTLFNVRLGWWCRNPLYSLKWKKDHAGGSLRYLLTELFGLTDYNTSCVYLSDGGHFENLAIYELVRRRCRVIVASDAGCDPELKFSDLGNALNKIRVDLGVQIDIDLSPIREQKKHCAIGTIRYRDSKGEPAEEGVLIYIKAMKCNKAPADVLSYEMENPDFPHQSTADQWFDEDQFESYRMLGFHTMRHICEKNENVGTMEEFQEAVRKYLKVREHQETEPMRGVLGI